MSKNIDLLNSKFSRSNDNNDFLRLFLNNPMLKSLIDVSKLFYC